MTGLKLNWKTFESFTWRAFRPGSRAHGLLLYLLYAPNQTATIAELNEKDLTGYGALSRSIKNGFVKRLERGIYQLTDDGNEVLTQLETSEYKDSNVLPASTPVTALNNLKTVDGEDIPTGSKGVVKGYISNGINRILYIDFEGIGLKEIPLRDQNKLQSTASLKLNWAMPILPDAAEILKNKSWISLPGDNDVIERMQLWIDDARNKSEEFQKYTYWVIDNGHITSSSSSVLNAYLSENKYELTKNNVVRILDDLWPTTDADSKRQILYHAYNLGIKESSLKLDWAMPEEVPIIEIWDKHRGDRIVFLIYEKEEWHAWSANLSLTGGLSDTEKINFATDSYQEAKEYAQDFVRQWNSQYGWKEEFKQDPPPVKCWYYVGADEQEYLNNRVKLDWQTPELKIGDEVFDNESGEILGYILDIQNRGGHDPWIIIEKPRGGRLDVPYHSVDSNATWDWKYPDVPRESSLKLDWATIKEEYSYEELLDVIGPNQVWKCMNYWAPEGHGWAKREFLHTGDNFYSERLISDTEATVSNAIWGKTEVTPEEGFVNNVTIRKREGPFILVSGIPKTSSLQPGDKVRIKSDLYQMDFQDSFGYDSQNLKGKTFEVEALSEENNTIKLKSGDVVLNEKLENEDKTFSKVAWLLNPDVKFINDRFELIDYLQQSFGGGGHIVTVGINVMVSGKYDNILSAYTIDYDGLLTRLDVTILNSYKAFQEAEEHALETCKGLAIPFYKGSQYEEAKKVSEAQNYQWQVPVVTEVDAFDNDELAKYEHRPAIFMTGSFMFGKWTIYKGVIWEAEVKGEFGIFNEDIVDSASSFEEAKEKAMKLAEELNGVYIISKMEHDYLSPSLELNWANVPDTYEYGSDFFYQLKPNQIWHAEGIDAYFQIFDNEDHRVSWWFYGGHGIKIKPAKWIGVSNIDCTVLSGDGPFRLVEETAPSLKLDWDMTVGSDPRDHIGWLVKAASRHPNDARQKVHTYYGVIVKITFNAIFAIWEKSLTNAENRYLSALPRELSINGNDSELTTLWLHGTTIEPIKELKTVKYQRNVRGMFWDTNIPDEFKEGEQVAFLYRQLDTMREYTAIGKIEVIYENTARINGYYYPSIHSGGRLLTVSVPLSELHHIPPTEAVESSLKLDWANVSEAPYSYKEFLDNLRSDQVWRTPSGQVLVTLKNPTWAYHETNTIIITNAHWDEFRNDNITFALVAKIDAPFELVEEGLKLDWAFPEEDSFRNAQKILEDRYWVVDYKGTGSDRMSEYHINKLFDPPLVYGDADEMLDDLNIVIDQVKRVLLNVPGIQLPEPDNCYITLLDGEGEFGTAYQTKGLTDNALMMDGILPPYTILEMEYIIGTPFRVPTNSSLKLNWQVHPDYEYTVEYHDTVVGQWWYESPSYFAIIDHLIKKEQNNQLADIVYISRSNNPLSEEFIYQGDYDRWNFKYLTPEERQYTKEKLVGSMIDPAVSNVIRENDEGINLNWNMNVNSYSFEDLPNVLGPNQVWDAHIPDGYDETSIARYLHTGNDFSVLSVGTVHARKTQDAIRCNGIGWGENTLESYDSAQISTYIPEDRTPFILISGELKTTPKLDWNMNADEYSFEEVLKVIGPGQVWKITGPSEDVSLDYFHTGPAASIQNVGDDGDGWGTFAEMSDSSWRGSAVRHDYDTYIDTALLYKKLSPYLLISGEPGTVSVDYEEDEDFFEDDEDSDDSPWYNPDNDNMLWQVPVSKYELTLRKKKRFALGHMFEIKDKRFDLSFEEVIDIINLAPIRIMDENYYSVAEVTRRNGRDLDYPDAMIYASYLDREFTKDTGYWYDLTEDELRMVKTLITIPARKNIANP